MNKRFALPVVLTTLLVTMLACQASGLIPTQAPAPTSIPLAPVSVSTTDLSAQQDALMTIYSTFSPGVVF